MTRSLTLAVVATAALLVPAAAPAQTDEAASFEFAPAKSGKVTSATFAAVLSGDRVVDRIDLQLPRGTRVDVGALPACEANYDQVVADERSMREMCPESTQAGSGTAKAVLGGNPVTFDLTVFALQDGLALAFESGGSELFTSRLRTTGRTFVVDLSLARQVDARAQEFGLSFARRPGFIRTPRGCPSGRRHKAAVVSFSDGERTTLRASQRCRR